MKADTLVDWSKVFQGDIAPLDFIFPGFLAGTVGGIIAPGGAGKSFLGIALCTALVSKDLLGMGIVPADQYVTYVTAEDPKNILEHRAHNLSIHLSHEERGRAREFFVLQSIHGRTPQILNNHGQRNERWVDGLKRAATGKRMLVLDTLRKFHQGEENDSGHMTLLTQILDEIAAETGAGILFLHHANKIAQLSGNGDSAAASRGSSALVDNIRFQMNLAGMNKSEASELNVDEKHRSLFVKLIGSKANYAESSGDHWLKRAKGGVLVEAPTFQSNVMSTKNEKRCNQHTLASQFSDIVAARR